MVELRPSKSMTRVRLPCPAPIHYDGVSHNGSALGFDPRGEGPIPSTPTKEGIWIRI